MLSFMFKLLSILAKLLKALKLEGEGGGGVHSGIFYLWVQTCCD